MLVDDLEMNKEITIVKTITDCMNYFISEAAKTQNPIMVFDLLNELKEIETTARKYNIGEVHKYVTFEKEKVRCLDGDDFEDAIIEEVTSNGNTIYHMKIDNYLVDLHTMYLPEKKSNYTVYRADCNVTYNFTKYVVAESEEEAEEKINNRSYKFEPTEEDVDPSWEIYTEEYCNGWDDSVKNICTSNMVDEEDFIALCEEIEENKRKSYKIVLRKESDV